MGTTPNAAIPYVEPTDTLANFPTQDKAQADRLDLLLRQASASWLRSAAFTVAAATQVAVLFDSQIATAVGITYNNTTGVFTVPVAGRYLVVGMVAWTAADTGGTRDIRLLQNGGLRDLRQNAGPTAGAAATESQVLTRQIQCAAGDSLTIAVFSTIATSLAVNASRSYVACEIYRLGP